MGERRIAFLGGDMRQMAAASRISELGYSVSVWGVPGDAVGEIVRFDDPYCAYGADALVLPLPMSSDGVTVNCVGNFRDKSPRIDGIFDCVGSGRPILAGRVPPRIADEAARRGIQLYDYYDSEELMINNAYLTAEAAVALAMNEPETVLLGAPVAVVGYGRIGKFLARMLSALGSCVTVAARKRTDLALASGFGLDTLRIAITGRGSSLESLSGCKIIFNTVPYWLFDSEVLKHLNADCLIIDLASAPGGVDPKAAQRYGIRVISAQGLPGKYAPLTAGRFIGDAIAELLPKIIR